MATNSCAKPLRVNTCRRVERPWCSLNRRIVRSLVYGHRYFQGRQRMNEMLVVCISMLFVRPCFSCKHRSVTSSLVEFRSRLAEFPMSPKMFRTYVRTWSGFWWSSSRSDSFPYREPLGRLLFYGQGSALSGIYGTISARHSFNIAMNVFLTLPFDFLWDDELDVFILYLREDKKKLNKSTTSGRVVATLLLYLLLCLLSIILLYSLLTIPPDGPNYLDPLLQELGGKLFPSCYTNWNSQRWGTHPCTRDFIFRCYDFVFTGRTNSVRGCGPKRIFGNTSGEVVMRSLGRFLTVQIRFYGSPRFPFSRPVCQNHSGSSAFSL